MVSSHILQVALPVPLPNLFDYLVPSGIPDIAEGARVLVPFGRKKLVGVVVGKAGRSEVPAGRLLAVSEVLDGVPATECVAVGRAAISRALLVGMDRAIRDLRAAVQ